MSKTDYCLGCGSLKQNTDSGAKGYVSDLNNDYCTDCFRLKNYGLVTHNFHPSLLTEIDPDSVVFMVSSILHLDLLFSYPVYRYQTDATYIYIINQLDLLPSSTNLDFLLENIIKKAKTEHVPYKDIIFMSAIKDADIDNLKEYVKSLETDEIILLGVQNSGKTTIYKGLTGDEKALSMIKAGLTQEKLEGNLDGKKIIDMPGLYEEGYLHKFLSYEVYKSLIPSKKIKPRIYQVIKNTAIFVEGLIAVTYLSKNENTFVFYLDNKACCHKTNESKVQNLFNKKDELFKITVPYYETITFKLKENKRYQITFADMGFLHVMGECSVKMTFPKGMHISLTEALFK